MNLRWIDRALTLLALVLLIPLFFHLAQLVLEFLSP
jgi:hypothetical protein